MECGGHAKPLVKGVCSHHAQYTDVLAQPKITIEQTTHIQ